MRRPRRRRHRPLPHRRFCARHGDRSAHRRAGPRRAEPAPLNPAALDLSPEDLACVKTRIAEDGLTVRGYRFAGDTLSRAARFETLSRELGPAFTGSTLPDSAGNPAGMKAQGKPPHSVFTLDLIDAAGEPTRQAVDDVIAFFKQKLLV